MSNESMPPEPLQGFILINKPQGVTSFYCIKKLYHLAGKKIKVGHAGTLDSFATGLVIVAINRTATKLLTKLLKLDKHYSAQAKLGQLTDSHDFTGTLLQEEDVSHITQQNIQDALSSFGTSYEQTPPIYSALKHEGRRISHLARQETLSTQKLESIVEQKKRLVHLYKLNLTSVDLPFFTFQAHVSHGTYIRSLAEDIGKKLNTHATTHTLKRTAIGPFTLDKAISLGDVSSPEILKQNLISIDDVLKIIENYIPTQQ